VVRKGEAARDFPTTKQSLRNGGGKGGDNVGDKDSRREGEKLKYGEGVSGREGGKKYHREFLSPIEGKEKKIKIQSGWGKGPTGSYRTESLGRQGYNRNCGVETGGERGAVFANGGLGKG